MIDCADDSSPLPTERARSGSSGRLADMIDCADDSSPFPTEGRDPGRPEGWPI